MNKNNLFFIIITILFLCGGIFAQKEGGTDYYSLPHSLKAAGIGEQGAASGNAFGAMQYNPAGLAFSDSFQVSYFRNPVYKYIDMPIMSLYATARLGKYGNIGIDFTSLKTNSGSYLLIRKEPIDYNSLNNVNANKAAQNSNDVLETENNGYERTLSLGYSYTFNKSLSAGAKLSYVWHNSEEKYNDAVLFSAGLLYLPELFNDRLSLGFSLMNFGKEFTYSDKNNNEYSDPAPAKIRFGVEANAIKNNSFDLLLSFEAAKPIEKTDENAHTAKSSFSSLFNDWVDFPNDMTGSVGLGYVWKPISLGKGISYIQETYFGYINQGIKSYDRQFSTFGINIGVEVKGIKFTTGIAGRWYDSDKMYVYSLKTLPDEVFQFSLSTNFEAFSKRETGHSEISAPSNIILSAGFAYGAGVGGSKETGNSFIKEKINNNNNWNVEADFYISKQSALIAKISYADMQENLHEDNVIKYDKNLEKETFTFESGYRFHPLGVSNGFFTQATLGVMRINPVDKNATPKYVYRPLGKLNVGALFFSEKTGVGIMPQIGFRMLFLNSPKENGIKDFNQFEFGLNVGYRF